MSEYSNFTLHIKNKTFIARLKNAEDNLTRFCDTQPGWNRSFMQTRYFHTLTQLVIAETIADICAPLIAEIDLPFIPELPNLWMELNYISAYKLYKARSPQRLCGSCLHFQSSGYCGVIAATVHKGETGCEAFCVKAHRKSWVRKAAGQPERSL